MFTVPSLDKFTENKEDSIIPGELKYGDGSLILNCGRNAVILKIVNNGDRPIQVFCQCVAPCTLAFWIKFMHFFSVISLKNSFIPYQKCSVTYSATGFLNEVL